MSALSWTKQQFSLLWQFLGFFQPPIMRALHAAIVLKVTLQIISSAFMSGHAKEGSLAFWANSWHFTLGLLLLPLAFFFTAYAIKERGIKRYYGYLWGETEVLLADIRQALHLKMLAPRPGGLATLVQGLGFGALLLTVLSGSLWFVSWHWQLSHAHFLRELHQGCASLLIAYFLGHGGMAALHYIKWRMQVVARKPDAGAKV